MTNDHGNCIFRAMSPPGRRSPFGVGFLLSQLGAHSAARFAEFVGPLGVTPPHVGLLRAIGASPGRSQQSLADEFGMLPSRIVVLLDDLEAAGLVERRRDQSDRRVHLLYITARGKDVMATIMEAGKKAERRLLASLAAEERSLLLDLLERVAEEQGLTPGVHPGYRYLRPGRSEARGGLA